MSKPRSKLINYKNKTFPKIHGFSTEIHFGQQAKHLREQPNYQPTKSIITIDIVTLQKLLYRKAGSGEWRGNHKEIIDFGITIGIYKPKNSKTTYPTTRGTVHYSKTGAHVVPAEPRRNQS